jgi:F-type H+-transporting ATPase subunit O
MFGGSGNYASAVYIAAVKANAVEKVDAELSQFVESVKASALTSQFIKDISVKKDVRVKTIHDIATEAKYSDVTKSFLGKTGFTYYSIILINLLFQLSC